MQDRALQTRTSLLDATFEALVELGYARTTTQEVCRRAGASRGKLLHHFPTRQSLVVAALEHVMLARLAEHAGAGPVLDPSAPGRSAELIDRLWATLQGPPFYAWLELTVAARTDPELRDALTAFMDRWDAALEAAFEALVPTGAVDPQIRGIASAFVFAVLNGLAVDRIYRSAEDVQPVVTFLKTLAATIERPFPPPAPLRS